MTAPPTGPVLRRVLIPVGLSALGIALVLPLLFGSMLVLDSEQARYVEHSFAIGSAAIFVLIAVGLRFALRGVGGAAPDDERAQRRVLRLPVRVAALFTVTGATATLLSALVRLFVAHDPLTQVFGVAMTTIALVGFLAIPLYLRVRAELMPHALFFAHEGLPSGRRLPLGLQVGYTVLAVAAVALVPASVFGAGRLANARAQAGRVRAQATARRLARVAAATDSTSEALRTLTHADLDSGGAEVLVRMPSGQLVPEDRALALAGAPTEEAPLGGELSGGAVLVVDGAAVGPQGPLLLVTLGLCLLAGLVALALARALNRDARGVTTQVEAIARGETPHGALTVSASEIRRVALALNRLLERIPRLQIEKFLAVERAEESRHLKSMFLANMSHDLRSPLNSILGFSELLSRGLEGEVSPGQRAVLDEMHETGSQLLRLLSEILDTARAESGHLDLEPVAVPMAPLLTHARREALRGRPERIADLVEVDLQAGTQPARVDALRMQQALTHVLNWAIDASETSGAVQGNKVHIQAGDRDRPGGRALVLEVSLPRSADARDEALLFQPFHKIEGVPGLHLALPLAKRIVEAHGGSMEPYGEGRLGVRIVLPRQHRRPR